MASGHSALRRRTRPLRHGLRRLRRRVRTRLTYLRFNRRFRLGCYAAALLLGLGLIWLVVTAMLARSQISALESRLTEVRQLVAAGRVDDARKLAQDIPDMAVRAHRLTSGPAWWVASEIPFFGEPAEVIRGTSTAVDLVGGRSVPQLLDVAALINPSTLRVNGDTVRLDRLQQAAPRLLAAQASLHRASADMAALPADTWLSSIDSRRTTFSAELRAIGGYVDAAVRVSKALPTMLGEHGVQRYFIGLQNESELRGTGGLPGAFTIAVADHGTVHFSRFESDSTLLPAATHQRIDTGLDFGRSYDELYGPSQPTTTYVDSNVSPNFPYAARIWAAMWQKVSGQRVDGVLAVDPTALSYFLAATGPAPLPKGGVVTADNVVPLTERDAYSLFPNNAQRKAFLVSVLKAAAKQLTSGAGSGYNIVRAASAAAGQRRLLAWSDDPAIERLIEQTSYAGTLPSPKRPLSALILNNAAAGKLDYYLARSLQYSRTGCGSRRDVLVTITLRNNAPASGLPPYVTERLDRNPPPNAKPGDSRVLLDYYASGGALLQSVSLNGRPTTASVHATLGHTVVRMDVELPRATTQTIVLHLDEPAGQGAPLIWQQPGVTPLAVSTFIQQC